MGRTPGTQIRRWFLFMAALLIAVNAAALAGSLVVTRSVGAVVQRAEPLVASTAAVRSDILAAQRELFRYLAEFADDTAPALAHLDALGEHLEEARRVATTAGVRDELDAIAQSAERYRKVLELMPGTVAGARDWSRLQEYSRTAVELGQTVADRATAVAREAREEIRRRTRALVRIARGVRWAAAGVLLASLASLAAFHHWWKRFQELILGI